MYITNILEYLERTAERLPRKICFSDGEESLSFSELYSISRKVGSHLLCRGFSGEPIAILMDKSPHNISACLGVIWAGCFYCVLDPESPPQRIRSILGTLGARVMIFDSAHRLLAESIDADLELIDYREASESEIDEKALAEVRAHQIDTDKIYVVFTSGSTGAPKGICASHRSVIDYTETLCEAIGFDEDTVFGNQTSLYFDAPIKEIMATLRCGACTYFVPRRLFMFPLRLSDFLNRHRINTLCWVVSALTVMSSLGVLERNPPQYLHTICFGSEVFPTVQYKKWRSTYPNARFFNLYGPTEATGMSCFWRADRELEAGEPIPIGKPFRNTEILLLGEDMRPVPQGECGEIYIRGAGVCGGYFGDRERTQAAFVQNPLKEEYPEIIYKTGDIGRYNHYGELVFVGRADSQIKHMGHRIELGEIEACLSGAEGVSRCCCVYDTESKRIILFYTGELSGVDVHEHLKSRLPRYMLPARCIRLEQMPLTESGKLDRVGMREYARLTENR